MRTERQDSILRSAVMFNKGCLVLGLMANACFGAVLFIRMKPLGPSSEGSRISCCYTWVVPACLFREHAMEYKGM